MDEWQWQQFAPQILGTLGSLNNSQLMHPRGSASMSVNG